MKKMAICLLFLSFSHIVSADVWLQDTYIKSIKRDAYSGSIRLLILFDKQPPNTNCAATDNPVSTNPNRWQTGLLGQPGDEDMNAYLSMAMTAYMSGRPVDIELSTTTCWSVGALLRGINLK